MKTVLLVHWKWSNTGGDWSYLLNTLSYYKGLGYRVYGLSTSGENTMLPDLDGLYIVKGLLQENNSSFVDKLSYPFRLWRQDETVTHVELNRFIETLDLVHVHSIKNSVGSRFLLSLPLHCKVLYSLHDYHLTCPTTAHLLKGKPCTKCIELGTKEVLINRCKSNSYLKSLAAWYSHLRAIDPRLIERVDKFLCPSSFLYNLHVEAGIPKNKLVVTNYSMPVNISNFEDLDMDHRDTKTRLLFLGRLSHEKGILTLLDSVRRLENIELSIYGRGPAAKEINHFIEANGLTQYVFMKGFINKEDIATVIASNDATIVPSEWFENYPFSVIESLGLGTPVIGAMMGGIPELINEGENGMLFEAGNSTDLKRVLEEFVRNGVSLTRREIKNNIRIKLESSLHFKQITKLIIQD